MGQGVRCCKYLLLTTNGFKCAKIDPKAKAVVDSNWATHPHVAQGDNCVGQANLEKAELPVFPPTK